MASEANARQESSSDTTLDNVPDGPPKAVIPPEEGLKGWLCVVGAFFCFFGSFGFLNAIGVFQTTYENTTLSSYTPSEISWIFAVQLFLMWAPGPIFGRIIDTFGPAPILWPCSALCVFSLGMTSLCTEYYQIFLAQGLGFGIGAGGVFTSAFVCVGQWFVKRRGLAAGISTVGSSLGGVIFPIYFDRLVAHVGFNGAIRYTALLIGVLLAGSCFLVTARLPRKKWNPDFNWFEFGLFKEKQFALYTFGGFFVMWGLWGPFNYTPSMAEENGFPPMLALYLISVINASSIPGRIIPPYLGDKVGHFNVITVCALVTGASIIALWLPFGYHPSRAGIIVFALIYGFVSGAYVSLVMPCCAKTGSIDTIGQRFGTFQIVIGFATLTGLPIMGAILNRQGRDFSGLQLFSGVSVLIGAGLTAGATFILGNKYKTRKF